MEAKEVVKVLKNDYRLMMSDIADEEKRLMFKRRCLLGLPIEDNQDSSMMMMMPESFLRQDDIFYDTLRTHLLQETFGTIRADQTSLAEEENLSQTNVKQLRKDIQHFLHIDAFSNIGLYRIAKLLSADSDSVKFEKTTKETIKVIKRSLLEDNKNLSNLGQKETLTQLTCLLNDSNNFRETSYRFFTLNCVSVATKLLNGLEDLPTHTLLAMNRKLSGLKTSIILSIPSPSGWNRVRLIKQIRKKCARSLHNGIKLQEPVGKAMALAELSMKLNPHSSYSSTADFFNKVSPEVKKFQDELVKAIWLLEKNVVRLSELESIKLLLGPETDVSTRSLRKAVKNMLTEYLFDISDLDLVPESLSETLAIINRSSLGAPLRCFSKEEMDKEVECILQVSTQVKQVLLDSLPNYEFDHDYNDAYIDELVQSDDSERSDDDDESHDSVEGTGDSMQPDCEPEVDLMTPQSPDTDVKSVIVEKKSHVNQYLAIQDVCDQTGIFAYDLIGRVMEGFAREEGLDLTLRDSCKSVEESREKEEEKSKQHRGGSSILQASEELMPSLPKNAIERLKKLMARK
ncbi:hypothetical protein ACFE04_028633 [Oxalis oulophora]